MGHLSYGSCAHYRLTSKRSFKARQNGLSVFCQRTSALRQSATRHCMVAARPSASSAQFCAAAMPQHRHPAVAAHAATAWQLVGLARQSPKFSGTALYRPVLRQSGHHWRRKVSAKCRLLFCQREHSNATTKHQQRNTGIRVVNARSCAQQPNISFKCDAHASHGRPLTLALGFS